MHWNPLLSDLLVENILAERGARADRERQLHLAEASNHPPLQQDARHPGWLRRELGVVLARLDSWVTGRPTSCGPAPEISCPCCLS